MPEKVTVELTDDQVYSITEYLATQTVPFEDAVTKATRVRRIHSNIEEFVRFQIGNLVASIVQQYPNPTVLADLEEIQRLKAKVEAASRPAAVRP